MARYIAEDNLPVVNEIQERVTVRTSFYTKYGKRCLDILLSLFALMLTLPINLIIALLTFITLGNPIFFRQKRVGKDCELFELVKFRNMTNATDENGVLLSPKERVTKVGKVLRKTSLDELLNFWSILKGDMSFIGPRPLVTNYLPRYSERHKTRHAVRPGLECPYVMNSTPTGNKWLDQFENDIWYVEHVSFLVDLKMCFALVRLVFDRKEYRARGNAKRGGFMGYFKDGTPMDNKDIPQEYMDRLRAEYGEIVLPEMINK